MNQVEFIKMDFYGKLDYMLGICGDAHRGLKGIVNEDNVWNYIKEVCNRLLVEFAVFSEDIDFSNESNFKNSYTRFRSSISNVTEIATLIKNGEANYNYLVRILETLITIIEANTPSDVRMARMFKTLLDNKTYFSEQIGVDEDEVERVLLGMLSNIDVIKSTIKNGSSSIKQER